MIAKDYGAGQLVGGRQKRRKPCAERFGLRPKGQGLGHAAASTEVIRSAT